MDRMVASVAPGSRITDYISLGVSVRFFPVDKVREAITRTRRASIRERGLPAHEILGKC